MLHLKLAAAGAVGEATSVQPKASPCHALTADDAKHLRVKPLTRSLGCNVDKNKYFCTLSMPSGIKCAQGGRKRQQMYTKSAVIMIGQSRRASHAFLWPTALSTIGVWRAFPHCTTPRPHVVCLLAVTDDFVYALCLWPFFLHLVTDDFVYVL